MKYLLVLLLVFLSSSALAVTVDNFCSELTWDNDKIECLKTARRGFIHEEALDICHELSFDNEKLNYTRMEVNTCKDLSFDTEKLKCLQDLGTIYRPTPPNDPRLSQIRKIAMAGLDSLRRGDIFGADQAFQQIINILSRP
jgi:hypothetical protein